MYFALFAYITQHLHILRIICVYYIWRDCCRFDVWNCCRAIVVPLCTTRRLEQALGKRSNHRPFWICVWGKLGQGNHVIIVTSSFSESSVFKKFSGQTKVQGRRFQIPPVCRAFSDFKCLQRSVRRRDLKLAIARNNAIQKYFWSWI